MPPAYNRAITAPPGFAQFLPYSLYLTTNSNGDWDNPDTFSSGHLIATFRRAETPFDQIGPETPMCCPKAWFPYFTNHLRC